MVAALSKLKWLVVVDNVETETAQFWEAPKMYGGPKAADIKTEVFLLPAALFAEKDGTFTNSARWMQWKWKAVDPPGQAKADQEILARLVLAVRELYKKEGGAYPEPVLNVSWSYTNPVNPDLGEVLKEINGKALADIPDPKDKTKVLKTAGQQVDGFAQLQDDGSTMCGNWLHSGVFTEAGQHGAAPATTPTRSASACSTSGRFSWPANRRVMYNRASADKDGNPWDVTRSGIKWNGEKWVGDVPDMKPDAPPGTFGAFIMHPEGVGAALRAGPQRRPVPRALRGRRSAGRQPPPPEGHVEPGDQEVLVGQGQVREEGGVPGRLHDVSPHRALPLLEPAQLAPERAPARLLLRDPRGLREGEGDREQHDDHRLQSRAERSRRGRWSRND